MHDASLITLIIFVISGLVVLNALSYYSERIMLFPGKIKGSELLIALELKRECVKQETFELSDLEYTQLNADYPRGKGSGLIGCLERMGR